MPLIVGRAGLINKALPPPPRRKQSERERERERAGERERGIWRS